jgi:hypothetical protein
MGCKQKFTGKIHKVNNHMRELNKKCPPPPLKQKPAKDQQKTEILTTRLQHEIVQAQSQEKHTKNS